MGKNLKICNKCHKTRKISDFWNDKTHRDGKQSICKFCKQKPKKLTNNDILLQTNKKMCSKCKKVQPLSCFYKDKSRKDNYCYCCKKCGKIQYLNYREKNKKLIKSRYLKNKPRIKKYNVQNRIKMNIWSREYTKNRRKNNISFKILDNLRRRVNLALHGENKSLSTMFLIGCEIDYLLYHIQKQFTKNMNWDNYGRGWYGKKEWHIDHIKPCASFDLSKPEEQLKCFNYKNLQPLWAEDNLSKRS